MIKNLANEKNATPAQISMAWMLCKKPYIVPIPGSRKISRIEENFGSSAITLTEHEINKIDISLDNMDLLFFGGSTIRIK